MKKAFAAAAVCLGLVTAAHAAETKSGESVTECRDIYTYDVVGKLRISDATPDYALLDLTLPTQDGYAGLSPGPTVGQMQFINIIFNAYSKDVKRDHGYAFKIDSKARYIEIDLLSYGSRPPGLAGKVICPVPGR